MIELGKTYFNTAGRPVRIICVDRAGPPSHPVVGLVLVAPAGTEVAVYYDTNGAAVSGYHDLIVPQRYVRLDDVLEVMRSHVQRRTVGVDQMRDELDVALHQLPFKELTSD
ncbi:hypothetical protein KNJ79_05220 [Sphingopyxis indica]|uniref:hypothetical protein n=1 Tax=Sphingopyxis indica TaxID=436663 RepID=UPI002938F4C2|nr:hypothetical protein [Sphingopyxis indica]WOF44333.1 hypothetical protein KNJ79_05220 [Sphingopyxis indica]